MHLVDLRSVAKWSSVVRTFGPGSISRLFISFMLFYSFNFVISLKNAQLPQEMLMTLIVFFNESLWLWPKSVTMSSTFMQLRELAWLKHTKSWGVKMQQPWHYVLTPPAHSSTRKKLALVTWNTFNNALFVKSQKIEPRGLKKRYLSIQGLVSWELSIRLPRHIEPITHLTWGQLTLIKYLFIYFKISLLWARWHEHFLWKCQNAVS
jgi:hypothetical protein